MADFKLPDVGEGLTEAEILTWKVAVGDEIAVNEVLVDIETAKSIVELPSPFAGVVTELLVSEGEVVTVGTPIVRIELVEEQGTVRPKPDDDGAHAGPEGGVLVGYGPKDHGTRRRRRSVETQVETSTAGPVKVAVLAKPPVRKMAKDLGINLADVPHEGRCVTRADIKAWQESRVETPTAADPEPPHAPRGGGRREPLSAVRRATAEAMVASAFTAPHVTEWVSVDVSASVGLVDKMRADPAFGETPVSILVLAARAVCLALRRHPTLHARWSEDALDYPAHIGLGIAAATQRGLLVPVVLAADTLTTPDLAHRIHELVTTARAGRLQPEQMSGGTFTITNVGIYGIDGGTPILPPGQTGILALGAVARRPWVDVETDEIVPRWVSTLALSFDHRVVDGEQASRFLADIARLLEDPALVVAF